MAVNATMTMRGNVGSVSNKSTFGKDHESVISFTVACNETSRGEDGKYETTGTLWVRVTAWRYLADLVEEKLEKGTPVIVTGRLSPTREYKDKDGNMKMSGLEMSADMISIPITSGGSSADDAKPAPKRAAKPKPKKAEPVEDPWDDGEDSSPAEDFDLFADDDADDDDMDTDDLFG